MNHPKRDNKLKPSRQGDALGLVNEEEKKFYKLNQAALDIWSFCDGKTSEKEIANNYYDIVKKSVKKDFKINEKLFKSDILVIIEKLKKYGLVE